MILHFLSDYLTGNDWELICDYCYRDRYQFENYFKIPAKFKGDAGIEGYIPKLSIGYQCYCPEKEYSDNELYEHYRGKLTEDLNKLMSVTNREVLLSIGVQRIKEWHYVIPENRDRRLLVHIENKRKEVIQKKNDDPIQYSYIDDDFQIVLKEAKDFHREISRYILDPTTDIKLNAAIKELNEVNLDSCDSEKLENIRKKTKALLNINDEENEDYKSIVKITVESYLKGIELKSMLRITFSQIFEELQFLETQYKTDVEIRSSLNQDRSMNGQLFDKIMDEFEEKLKCKFPKFTYETILELRRDMISAWIADCSLRFK